MIRRAQAAGAITADELPAPHPVVTADSFGIRLTGVGGTGVVTVSQVLATAGLIAGWHARSLDQTGLAQKGGAVVSDVRQIVLGLFGDDQFANVFGVGAGFQAGALPPPPDAIEEALRVNGVAVENIQAFRRGRQYIADPAAVLSAAGLDGLPDAVRGYEDVKLRNVESYHRSLAELRAQLDASAASSA